MSSKVLEREPLKGNEVAVKQNHMSSKLMERVPIKITGTDINGNKLELNTFTYASLKEGEPISINHTQINVNPRKSP